MNLYLIERPQGVDDDVISWDEYCGHVIAADNQVEVRILASKEAGDEGAEVWTNSGKSKCRRIATDCIYKKPQIVLSDFNAG